MPSIQSKLKQIFFNKLSGVIFWILSWPFVSMLFYSHPHYPAFITPIVIFSRSSMAPEGYYWSFAYFENEVFPAAVFWLVLIGVIVFLPSKQCKRESGDRFIFDE